MRAPPGRVALSIATGLLLALGGTQSAGAFSVDPDAAPADAELAADVEEIGATGASAPVDAAEPAFPAVDAAPAAGEPDPVFDDVFDEMEELGVSDPLESTNRAILRFNRGVDSILLDPLTRFYRFVLPVPARRGIRNVFLNLDSPSILVNDLLQLRLEDAAITLGRLVLNSTAGFGGLFDAGAAAGWERHDADFGQTLARFGVGSGPYLIFPLFGPSTVRDGFGNAVDVMLQPLTYFIGPFQLLIIGTGSGFAAREALIDGLNALDDSSVDFYAALRSAYVQSREAQIWFDRQGADATEVADSENGGPQQPAESAPEQLAESSGPALEMSGRVGLSERAVGGDRGEAGDLLLESDQQGGEALALDQ